MGRSGTVACVLAGWLSLAACEPVPVASEVGAFACTNGLDEDGDRKTDCEDPDCWGYARCRVTQDAGMPPLGPAKPAEMMPLDPVDTVMTPRIVDAQVPMHVPMRDDAAIEADAAYDAALPPLLCDPSCPEHRCVDGECTEPVDLGAFVISSVEISVPRAVGGRCLDSLGACTLMLDVCCPPDPDLYITVAGTKVGHADIDNFSHYIWRSLNLPVHLREDDVVLFELFDDDTADLGIFADDEPDRIFDCTTTLSLDSAESGEVRCAPGLEGADRYEVIATISPAANEP